MPMQPRYFLTPTLKPDKGEALALICDHAKSWGLPSLKFWNFFGLMLKTVDHPEMRIELVIFILRSYLHF